MGHRKGCARAVPLHKALPGRTWEGSVYLGGFYCVLSSALIVGCGLTFFSGFVIFQNLYRLQPGVREGSTLVDFTTRVGCFGISLCAAPG